MLTLTNLTKRYGKFVAVDDLSLEVRSGELFGFLGPNGAGKTTTIKMICGLLRPTSGTVQIAGYDIQKEPLRAKAVLGLVPDSPVLAAGCGSAPGAARRSAARLQGVRECAWLRSRVPSTQWR